MRAVTTSASETRPGRAEKKAAQRRTILEAAKSVFFRDGFMQANLDEVAQIAGVAKGTLYRYFDNKGELYVAVLSHNGEIFESRMREAGEQGAGPVDRLRSVGRFYFDHWTRNREYFQIFWAVDNQSVIGELPPAVVDEVVKLWESCLQILAGVVERGVTDGHFRRCDPWPRASRVPRGPGRSFFSRFPTGK